MKEKLVLLTIAAALALSLVGCGKARTAESATPAPETQITAEVQTPAPTPSYPVRKVGERFEETITVLGMEETAHYEHIRNDALGFEMDYDYELFKRYTDADCERFVSVWDDPGNIENYFEIRADAGSAELVTEAIIAELSNDYDLIQVTRELDRAGSCVRIEASVIKNTNRMADQLQAVYIIPAPDGCRVVREHCYITESEGFFRRFDHMLNTLSVFER